MTNAVEGNEILIFKHKKHQGLIQVKRVSANGVGTGSGLGNQGGLVVSEKFPLLFVVNAGSDTISMFKIGNNDLHLLDTISSQGVRPVSIAVNKNRVYVLNAGSDSIAGFKVNYHGKLVPIAESVRTLSGTGTAAAQISFSPRGDFLIVTEKATNTIVTFVLDEDNLPGEANVNASAGVTPFGFAFD
ncbi:MAG: beta-propeller fold lactonase family protein, partial [Pseudomonadales bacterium]|nr:beta-propeller fold lactonase family protein [Pseudomonadales bacterium]